MTVNKWKSCRNCRKHKDAEQISFRTSLLVQMSRSKRPSYQHNTYTA